MMQYLIRLTAFHDLSEIHDYDPIRNKPGRRQIMADKHECRIIFLCDLLQHMNDIRPHRDV